MTLSHTHAVSMSMMSLPLTAKSAEQAAKAVTSETQSTKRAAVTAPVPFSSEDNVQEYSAPAPAATATATGASAPTTGASAPVAPAAATGGFSNGKHLITDVMLRLFAANAPPLQ
jgi:predicted nucleic acid-binding Zn ribbon protein